MVKRRLKDRKKTKKSFMKKTERRRTRARRREDEDQQIDLEGKEGREGGERGGRVREDQQLGRSMKECARERRRRGSRR